MSTKRFMTSGFKRKVIIVGEFVIFKLKAGTQIKVAGLPFITVTDTEIKGMPGNFAVIWNETKNEESPADVGQGETLEEAISNCIEIAGSIEGNDIHIRIVPSCILCIQNGQQ